MNLIEEFRFDLIEPYSAICLCGKRRSGKGVLSRDLCSTYYKNKVDNGFLFSPTAEIANNPMNFIKPENRFKELDIDIINEIIFRQEEIIKEDPKGRHHTLILIDDVVGSLNENQKKTINKLFILGRHLRITLIYCIQSIKNEFTPTMRQNADCIFIFSQTNFFNKEQLALEYLNVNENKKEMIKLIDNFAKGHQSLVILNTEKSNDLDDYVFFYTASFPIKDFNLTK